MPSRRQPNSSTSSALMSPSSSSKSSRARLPFMSTPKSGSRRAASPSPAGRTSTASRVRCPSPMKRRRARSGPRPSASRFPKRPCTSTYRAPDAPPWRFASPATRTASRSGTATQASDPHPCGLPPKASQSASRRPVRPSTTGSPTFFRTKVPRSPAAAGPQPGSRPSTAFHDRLRPARHLTRHRRPQGGQASPRQG